MSAPPRLSALSAYFGISVREQLRYRGNLVGMMAFLGVLLFIFSRLWHTVAEGSGGTMQGPYTTAQLVLYLLVAELVIMAPANSFTRISAEVKSGDVALALLRPVPYVAGELAREAGTASVRLLGLALVGFPVALLLGGRAPLDPRGVALGMLVLVPMAVLFECGVRLQIGLLSFWMEESTPVYWIWQKANFVLGGLMLPLDLYPPWLRRGCELLPFQALLYGPARTVVAYDPELAAGAVIRLLLWGALLALLLQVTYATGKRRIHANGG